MRLGTFQFLDRLPGRVSAKVNASAHCPRKRPDTRGLRPRRIPELARAFEPTLILRAGRLHRPAAQPFVPPLRPPIVPPLLMLPQIDHPCGPTVSPRATGLLQLEHRAPLFQAVVIAARRKAGAHPGPPHTAAASRRSPCAGATSRAPPRSRSVWSAQACWRCRRVTARSETYRPRPAFHKRPNGLLTRRHCPFEGPVPPPPDGNDSMEGPVPPGPRDAVERVPPSDAVGRVPPGPHNVEAALALEKTGGSGGIRPPRRPAGRPGFIPARPTQQRQAAAVHAPPPPRTAPPNSRSVCRRGGR